MIADVQIDKKGLCYNNNELLKAAGVSIPLTAEHIAEIEKCASDILYFVHNYVNIVTLDDGVQKFKTYPYQDEWIDACYNNRFVIGKWSRQSGKCVSPGTMLKLRNTETGEEVEMTAKEFYEIA